MSGKTRKTRSEAGASPCCDAPGIVIADGKGCTPVPRHPRIHAFIWGGKVRPNPTLPYGRWKGAA